MHFSPSLSVLQDIKRDVCVQSALNRWVFAAWISTVTVSGSVAITACSTTLMLRIDHAAFSSGRVFLHVLQQDNHSAMTSCRPAWKVLCVHSERTQGIISVIHDDSKRLLIEVKFLPCTLPWQHDKWLCCA